MNHLTVEDIWPLLNKLPHSERKRLLERLMDMDGEWLADELADLRDWSAQTDDGDSDLLDPAEGKPFRWPDNS